MSKLDELIDKSMANLERLYHERGKGVENSTGFADLDCLIGGFSPGTVTAIAGRPSMGVTAFCLNVAEHYALTLQKPVVYFTLENSDIFTMQRLICSVAGISSLEWREQNRDENILQVVNDAASKLRKSNIQFEHENVCRIEELEKVCRHAYEANRVPSLIIIDPITVFDEYQQNSVFADSFKSVLWQRLKKLATDLHCAILVAATVSRSVERRRGNRPILADLDEASPADCVLLLYRDEYYKLDSNLRGRAEIIVAKNRFGPVGTIELLFSVGTARFLNMEHLNFPSA